MVPSWITLANATVTLSVHAPTTAQTVILFVVRSVSGGNSRISHVYNENELVQSNSQELIINILNGSPSTACTDANCLSCTRDNDLCESCDSGFELTN